MKNAYNHRLRLVESAKQRGIKPTARLFTTTVLLTTNRRKRLPPEVQLVELRKTLPTFGSRRRIREFDLPISHP
jgi:hypothetical protein